MIQQQGRSWDLYSQKINSRILRAGFKLVLTLLMFLATTGHAAEFNLTNGDKISGDIISETDTHFVVRTVAMGSVTINKEFLEVEVPAAEPKDEWPKWDRTITIGFSQAGGNTDTSDFKGDVSINRKTADDEWTAKLNSYIATTNEEEDARKFYGMLRYAYSFGEKLKWYHFTKMEADQDQFANVNYRLTPSSGVGYWFSDKGRLKAMAELAIGFEHTDYADSTNSENEIILVPRGFFDVKLVKEMSLREDITLYPSLEELGDFRLHSETKLVNPINDVLSWNLSFIDDFNSDPTGSSKKNDYRLVSSFDINF